MIRINLIGGAPGQAPQRAAMDMAQRVTVACSVILVVTIVVIGWRYWSLRQEAVQVQQELVAATQELGRLDTVIDQVTALDARREELSRTVTLVDQLQHHKSRPVRMLDEVSSRSTGRVVAVRTSPGRRRGGRSIYRTRTGASRTVGLPGESRGLWLLSTTGRDD